MWGIKKDERMYKYVIKDIEWDVDDPEDLKRLPREVPVIIDQPMTEDDLSNLLSDRYGFCHNGFTYEEIKE